MLLSSMMKMSGKCAKSNAHKVISAARIWLFRMDLSKNVLDIMEEFGDMSVTSLPRDELNDLLEKYSDNEPMVVDYDDDIYEYWNKETVLPSRVELEEILKE